MGRSFAACAMAISEGTGVSVPVTGSSQSGVGSGSLETKNPTRVFAGHLNQFVDRHLSYQRESLRHVAHKAGLVALAPMRNRGEIGTVGLEQQPVDRGLENGVVEPPVLKGHHSTERHIVAEDQPRSQERHAAAEGMEDDRYVGMPRQNGGDVFIRFSCVDDRRLLCLRCERELSLESKV